MKLIGAFLVVMFSKLIILGEGEEENIVGVGNKNQYRSPEKPLDLKQIKL